MAPSPVKRTRRSAAYNQTTFYEAWRPAIQRYGIFNPYTPQMTGSYEQASAIQDTLEVVA